MKYKGGMLPDQWPRSVQADIAAVKAAVESTDADVQKVRSAVETTSANLQTLMGLLFQGSNTVQTNTRSSIITAMHDDLMDLAMDVKAVRTAVETIKTHAVLEMDAAANKTTATFSRVALPLTNVAAMKPVATTRPTASRIMMFLHKTIQLDTAAYYSVIFPAGTWDEWKEALAEVGVRFVAVHPVAPPPRRPPRSILGLEGTL